MQSMIFATGNTNKIREVRELLANHYQILGLQDIGCEEDIPETSPTIAGNALLKARYVAEKYQVNCFAEDTGLEVDALNGEPGVYSARYAGEGKDPAANTRLVLEKLCGQANRRARFRTVFALILDGVEHLFEGIAEGNIAETPRGKGGFGYDPVFIPDGYALTFAEMDSATKNAISHRGKAVRKLLQFLENNP